MRKVSKFQLRLNEPLGLPECPYMRRWVLNLGAFSVRLHLWYRSDDKRYFHDHPWWFANLILWGSYADVSPEKRDVLKLGSLRFRGSRHRHYVEVLRRGTLSLLITGPPARNWGFWVNGKFKRPLKYFHRYGHPPCSEN